MGKQNRRPKGVISALGTPLDERENLHREGMRRQVRMQLRSGVGGLLVAGSMGAMQMLKERTFQEAVAVAADEVRGRVPLIIGCGDNSTERTLAHMAWISEQNVDGLAILPPHFFLFSQTELESYFRELARASDLPIYLYDNPHWTKHALDYDLIARLSQEPNIVGLKASGDLLTVRRCAEELRRPDFRIYSGQSPFFDVTLGFGADGIIDGLFALAPEIGMELLSRYRQGDLEGAARAQSRLGELTGVLQTDSVFGGFTAAMNLRGIPGNFAARPFTSISPEGRQRARRILQEMKLI